MDCNSTYQTRCLPIGEEEEMRHGAAGDHHDAAAPGGEGVGAGGSHAGPHSPRDYPPVSSHNKKINDPPLSSPTQNFPRGGPKFIIITRELLNYISKGAMRLEGYTCEPLGEFDYKITPAGPGETFAPEYGDEP